MKNRHALILRLNDRDNIVTAYHAESVQKLLLQFQKRLISMNTTDHRAILLNSCLQADPTKGSELLRMIGIAVSARGF